MYTPNTATIRKMCDDHFCWLDSKKTSGARAIFDFMDLTDLNFVDYTPSDFTWLDEMSFVRTILRGATFRHLILTGADFTGAVLDYADMRWTCVENAIFNGASLVRAELSSTIATGASSTHAVLDGAIVHAAEMDEIDFSHASLVNTQLDRTRMRRANLCGANLSQAFLDTTDLVGSCMDGAILDGTCLDPANKPNGLASCFECDGEFIVGYRSKCSVNGDYSYEPGQVYEVEVFSTALMACHPGLYLFPQYSTLVCWMRDHTEWTGPVVKVWAKAEETHHTEDKWRCKKFYKVEDYIPEETPKEGI